MPDYTPLTVYVCAVPGLYRKWLPHWEITDDQVAATVDETIEYFGTVSIDATANASRDFWLECPYPQPYLYLAVEQYAGLDDRLQHAADLITRRLTANPSGEKAGGGAATNGES